MRTTIALLLATTSLFAGAAPAASDLAWLAGDWHRCRDGEIVEERWLGPRGDMLVGVNLTTSAARASFEHLRIARDGEGWVLWAAPMGRTPVPFRMVESGAARAVFANPEHGFPARIAYWREGDDLLARIEGTSRGQPAAVEWRFASGMASDCRRTSERIDAPPARGPVAALAPSP
jgi:hypothetical protein